MAEEGVITLTIDGRDITAKRGQTILEVARSAGIYIPGLCYYPGLKPLPQVMPDEACQLCIVEAKDNIMSNGNIVLSCITTVSEGMLVETKTPMICELQQKNLLAILGRQPTDICFKKKTAILQCWGKVHYDLTWEERASPASGNVRWIESHIIKKLSVECYGASFSSFALTGRAVTILKSWLEWACEKITESEGETVWNTRYRRSYPLIQEPRAS